VRPLLLVATLGAIVLTACGGGGDGAATVGSPEATQPTDRPSAEQVGPAIEGTGLQGEPLSIAEHRGRSVLVNVWSSW
jgi:hypothetical protein